MSARQYAIFLQTDGCRIAAVEQQSVRWSDCQFDRSMDASAQSTEIAGALRQMGHHGEPVLLALPGTMCLPAPISLSGLPARDRKAMRFRLEEQLPLAAEEFAADFVIDGSSALGVAVATQQLQPLVDALESSGVPIATITPAALLVAAGTSDGTALIREDELVNVISMNSGAPRRWAMTANDPESLRVALAMAGSDANPADARVHEVDESAARQAAEILRGAKRPVIELRRDALAPADRLSSTRGPLNALLAAAAVLMLAVAGAALVRATRYNRAADRNDAALAADFQAAFPGWDTANIPAVVESEHRKLNATAATKLPQELKASALRTLRDVIVSLPSDTKFTVDRMTFDEGSFDLEGHAASLEDLDALAKAARSSGMDVPPPQSRREEDGRWSFTLRGNKAASTASLPQEAR